MSKKTIEERIEAGREYRRMAEIRVDAQEGEEQNYVVEGYATTFNEPYVLWEDRDGWQMIESIDAKAFENTDMSDVIMQYDHEGKVLARNSNGSLMVGADENGLFFAADLGRTEAARSLYDDVKEGMVTKMSWRFRCGTYYFDQENRTIVHKTVKKIYDVAPVSLPANDDTVINARAWVDGEIARAARSEAELNERRRKLRLKINITGGI